MRRPSSLSGVEPRVDITRVDLRLQRIAAAAAAKQHAPLQFAAPDLEREERYRNKFSRHSQFVAARGQVLRSWRATVGRERTPCFAIAEVSPPGPEVALRTWRASRAPAHLSSTRFVVACSMQLVPACD